MTAAPVLAGLLVAIPALAQPVPDPQPEEKPPKAPAPITPPRPVGPPVEAEYPLGETNGARVVLEIGRLSAVLPDALYLLAVSV